MFLVSRIHQQVEPCWVSLEYVISRQSRIAEANAQSDSLQGRVLDGRECME